MGNNLNFNSNTSKETKEEIKALIRKFQEGYSVRDINIIDTFVEELFINTEDTLLIGTADSEWCIGIEEIKSIIKSDWQFWGDVSIDSEAAVISSKGNTAWFYTTAIVRNKPGTNEDKYLNRLLEEIKTTCTSSNTPRERVLKILENASLTLLHLEKGAEFIWPFRLCGVAIKEKSSWKLHQLQFSFPTVMPPDVRYNSMEQYEKKQLPRGSAAGVVREEINKVLEKFQEGYSKRDINVIDQFINELFVKDEDVLIVGTAHSEIFQGVSAVKELIENDWLYWANVKIFIENAVISSNEDTVWLATDAVLTKTMSEQQFSDGLINTISEDINSDMPTRGKLLHTMQGISHILYHSYQGDEYIRPFRFTAVLVKSAGTWKFKQMQFSHPTITTPDVRIIDNKAFYGFIEY